MKLKDLVRGISLKGALTAIGKNPTVSFLALKQVFPGVRDNDLAVGLTFISGKFGDDPHAPKLTEQDLVKYALSRAYPNADPALIDLTVGQVAEVFDNAKEGSKRQ